MESMEWLKSPKIRENIHPDKLALLNQFLSQSNIKSKEELVPFFIAAASQANSKGMSFTDKETDIILEALKESVSEAERTRVDTIRQLAKMITAKKN